MQLGWRKPLDPWGRSGLGCFILAIFLSPLIAAILLLAGGRSPKVLAERQLAIERAKLAIEQAQRAEQVKQETKREAKLLRMVKRDAARLART